MKHGHNEEGEHWLSVSDMMSGLMVIFLFIAISYMMQVSEEKEQLFKEKKQLIEVAETYNKTKKYISDDLNEQFKNDLLKWDAEIDNENLTVRFRNPEILFDVGKAELKPKFTDILNAFFPRYIEVLDKYKEDIEEIRIEGHTSSEYSKTDSADKDKDYFLNMALSQDRTRATLEYCLMLPEIEPHRDWLKTRLTANGLSSSKIIKINEQEDAVHSRRVEFKVKTNAEKQISEILQRK